MRQLYLVAGVTMAGVSAVFALFAELEKRYDLSTTSLGWIAGSAFIASLIAQLWLSRYADRGHAATLLRLGVLAAAVGLIWFAAATEVWQFVSARALLGAGVGMIVPPARRAIVISADGNSGERLGTFYASYLAGFVFGPPIAGALTIVGDVRLPFAVFGVLTFLTLLSILRMELPEGRPVVGATGDSAEAAADKRVLRRLLVERRIVAALLVVVSFRYSIGVFEPLWATHLDDLGASTTTVTLSLTFFALPMLLVARPAGRLSDRVGPRWASLLAALATVPMMAIYGYVGVVWIIFAVAIPHGLMEAILSPGSQAAIAEAAPDEDAASAQGLAEASGSAAAAIGAFTAPALFDLLGAGPAWLIAAIVMGGLLATSWLLDPPRRSSGSARETLTTIDRQGDAGDEASLVAVEEQRRVGDIPT
ncbi:MAG: MFS transporter [Acidimicrobiales bacterium]